MGVLLPNYPEENVKGENVPNFKINTSTGTSSNVFQILQDLQLKQYKHQYSSSTVPTVPGKVHCTVPRQFSTSMEMCMDNCLPLTTEKTQQKQFQGKASEQCYSTHSISPDSQKNTVLSHAEFPPSMESMPSFPGKQFLQGKLKFILPDIENMPFFPGNQFLQGKKKSTLGSKLKPFMDTCTFTLGTDQRPFVDTDQKPSSSSKDTHKKRKNDCNNWYDSYDWYHPKNSQHDHHTYLNEFTTPG